MNIQGTSLESEMTALQEKIKSLTEAHNLKIEQIKPKIENKMTV